MLVALTPPLQFLRTPERLRLRKKSGWGCIICGQPICSYYEAGDNVTLLCLQHYREAATGNLSSQQIAAAQSAPYNLQKGNKATNQLSCPGNNLKVILGHITLYGNYAFNSVIVESYVGVNNRTSKYSEGSSLSPLMIDDKRLFEISIQDTRIAYTLELSDEYNLPLLRLTKNTVFYAADDIDCRIENNTLLVTRQNKPLVEIRYEAPDELVVSRAQFILNGVQLVIDNNILTVNGAEVAITPEELSQQHSWGIIIGVKPEHLPCIKHIERVSRVIW